MVSGESSMVSGEYGTPPAPPGLLAGTWQATLFLGVLTLILGIIVSFHPTGSLNVLAVLLGVLMIFSGIFHLIRVFDPGESHRVWLGIAGLLFIVIGVVLIRHLHLTRAIVGLIIGITWIVQGLAALIGGISGGAREGRAWWIIFGVVSLIAGIVVVSAPASSLNTLAVLLGIWFIIVGIFEIIGGFMLRARSAPRRRRPHNQTATYPQEKGKSWPHRVLCSCSGRPGARRGGRAPAVLWCGSSDFRWLGGLSQEVTRFRVAIGDGPTPATCADHVILRGTASGRAIWAPAARLRGVSRPRARRHYRGGFHLRRRPAIRTPASRTTPAAARITRRCRGTAICSFTLPAVSLRRPATSLAFSRARALKSALAARAAMVSPMSSLVPLISSVSIWMLSGGASPGPRPAG